MLTSNVTITGSDHRFFMAWIPIFFSRPLLRETIVESDVWVGHGANIMARVKIGHGSIIAAHAAVTKDVPAYEVFGGVPEKVIRNRFLSTTEVSKHEVVLRGKRLVGVFSAISEVNNDSRRN